MLGIDFAEAAIEIAWSRVRTLPEEVRTRVEFRVGDALRPSTWKAEVRSVVDSGFFHLFDRPVRMALVRDLAQTLKVGGRYYMLGFGVALPSPVTIRERDSAFIRIMLSPVPIAEPLGTVGIRVETHEPAVHPGS